jgi:hypothetical protein
MNYQNDGVPICKIMKKTEKESKNDKSKIIFVDPDPEAIIDSEKEIKVKQGYRIQHIPNYKQERSILYIVAPSGAGKSYYVVQWVKEYKKMYPKRQIYLFSSLEEDPTIDKLKKKGMKRIKLDENFMQCQFTIEDFRNMVVIFDDCDCIRNKALKMKVLGIMDMLLETGRHSNTSLLITAHIGTRQNESRKTLNESHSLTVYPATMGGKSCKTLLEGYFGLDNAQIKKLKRLPSRWVTICKTYPMVVLYEGGAYVLNND